MADPVIEQGASASAPVPVAQAPAAEVVAAPDDSTLLGVDGDKPAGAAPVVKEPTPEEKAAAEAKATKDAETAAANKKLLESDDKTLTPEQLEQKKELLKQAEIEKGKVVPEKYEFKMPDGVKVNQELVDAVSPVLKELKITQADAQRLVDAYTPVIQKQTEAMVKAQADESMKVFNQIKTEWKNETEKLLGANKDVEIAHAARFINKFGSPALRQVLNETGLGNHPELVKVFIEAGKKLSQDPMPTGKTQSPVGQEGGLDPAKFYTHASSPKA
jgi:hypothetical protein